MTLINSRHDPTIKKNKIKWLEMQCAVVKADEKQPVRSQSYGNK